MNINCNGSYTFTVESNDWNTTRNYLHIQFHMQRSLILLNRFRQKYYITWMGKTTCSSQVKKINTIKFHGHMYGVFMTGIILWDIVYSYTTKTMFISKFEELDETIYKIEFRIFCNSSSTKCVFCMPIIKGLLNRYMYTVVLSDIIYYFLNK